MQRVSDTAWLPLIVETNDLRRTFGQALHTLATSLLLAHARGRPFERTVRHALAGAASAFGRQADRLRRAGAEARDPGLRRLVAATLARLADDLAGGDARHVPCVRGIEMRLADVARLLREPRGARRLDVLLARDLAAAFAEAARAAGPAAADRLRRAADAVRCEESPA
jgi:hypothetical protein